MAGGGGISSGGGFESQRALNQMLIDDSNQEAK